MKMKKIITITVMTALVQTSANAVVCVLDKTIADPPQAWMIRVGPELIVSGTYICADDTQTFVGSRCWCTIDWYDDSWAYGYPCSGNEACAERCHDLCVEYARLQTGWW
jgi:hypothetical protein